MADHVDKRADSLDNIPDEPPPPKDRTRDLDPERRREKEAQDAARRTEEADRLRFDPPRTTEGWLTTPKFGAAGSGGAEYEPGEEKD